MLYTVQRNFRSYTIEQVEATSAREAMARVKYPNDTKEILENLEESERNASGNGENVGDVY